MGCGIYCGIYSISVLSLSNLLKFFTRQKDRKSFVLQIIIDTF